MVVRSPTDASQSEFKIPRFHQNCWRPLDADELAYGYPGMQLINTGAAYADIYGADDSPQRLEFRATGTRNVVFFYGDGSPSSIARADAVAHWLDLHPHVGDWSPAGFARWYWCANNGWPFECRGVPHDAPVSNYRLLRDGNFSPYSFYQFRDIEGTYLGPGNYSFRNGSMSATFCSYAYALGGPPMTPHVYTHDELVTALGAFWNTVFALCDQQCRTISGCPGFRSGCISGGEGDLCEHMADQVANCMTTGICDVSDPAIWQRVIFDFSTVANTISPDRLAGVDPRHSPEACTSTLTTWSCQPNPTWVTWNSAGGVFGCYY